MVYLVLILVFSLAKESFGSGIKASSDSNKPSLTTLFQALDTSQKIWMKMHNYAVEAVSCFYYGKILLRHNVYDFDEYYTKGDPSWSPQKKKNFMTATLSEGTDGPVMWVRPRASKAKGTPYTFRFWNSDEKCGIFTYPPDDRCEQIVWGSVVRANATSCNEAYKTICGTKRYNEYKESCGI
ncbi:uncharacterized protein LOC119432994 isoform X1 [Dermacentor silvarum]|uniref:uncharacterized protein LOC119432994 isoform X1 n=1 Tax=Dermacentor silvarum TaxID=543639 RepID=UPI001898CD5D|nr:uncharacterized protein LOC119432994 isoform X1 [Dermacentor silvarum]